MTNVSEELTRLAQLRDQGVLTDAEFEAQKAALLNAGSTPPPHVEPARKRPSKAGIGCLVLIAILVVLYVIGSNASSDSASGSDATTTAESSTPPIAVTATELFQAYDANEAAAQQQYGSSPLLVTGTIKSIDLDFGNDPVVMLSTPNEFMSAHANLTKASQTRASSLSKGAQIKLLCKSVAEVAGTPILKGCDIQ
ncbi:OB-fold protein [Sphingomonas paucimobilis]|uniref:OB-fold protein n=1 Tax=Sphingomonas paucimobilis TaxID=13689 RepID=UPI003D978F81